MRKFKLKQGRTRIFDLERGSYERLTRGNDDYIVRKTDGSKTHIAICLHCDNPIQIIGCYVRETTVVDPYARHYDHDTKIAKHNQQAYLCCPYASKRHFPSASIIKKTMTDFERSIYYCVRDYFDIALYIMGQETGIHITENLAKKILADYLGQRGYMYYLASLNNIPWMLMKFAIARPCFGMLIEKDGFIYKYFKTREDVKLVEGGRYIQVKSSGGYLNLEYALTVHEQKIKNGNLEETLAFSICSKKKLEPPVVEFEKTLTVDESCFLNLISSEDVQQFRSQRMLNIAKNMMTEI